MTYDFTPDQEDLLLNQIQTKEQKLASFQRTATPDMANMVGTLYRQNPNANIGAILSASQAVASGKMSLDAANKLLLQSQKTELNEAVVPKKESWWERNVAGPVTSKIRTASRWTMASLNFVPQMAVGAAAQIFDKNDDVDGWFVSTDLGTLIKNDEVAGDGFFIGGRAAQLQAERARRYRGEIDGRAWTIGRGFASVLTQPGTKPYNILSGFIDAGTAVVIPAAPGFQAAKGAVATAGMKAGEIGGVGLFTKSAAGLLDGERAAIDLDKVKAWLPSRGGQQAMIKVAAINNIEDAQRAFPKVHDAGFWLEVIDADTPEKAQELLLKNLGQGVDDIDLSDRSIVEKLAGRSSNVARLSAQLPGRHLVLAGGNDRDVAASVVNLSNYLKLYAKRMSDTDRQDLVKQYTEAVVKGGKRDPYDALTKINDITVAIMRENDVPEEAIEQMMISMKGRIDKDVHGALDQAGRATNHGTTVEVDGVVYPMPVGTAGIESEMMKTIAVTLPDPRKVRRITSDYGWLFTGKNKNRPENFGNLRIPASALESLQNEIWRPLTLMTPGYVYRNLTDSAFRLAFTPGLKGGPFHPVLWIQMAMYKKLRGDVTGRLWKMTDEELAEAADSELGGWAEEFARAKNQTFRELQSQESLFERSVKQRVWNKADRSDVDKSRYTKGLRDQIRLLHLDEGARVLAKGFENEDDAVRIMTDFLSSPQGRGYAESIERLWADSELTNRATGDIEVRSPRLFVENAQTGELEPHLANIKNLTQYLVRRLSHETGNNKNLMDAVATGRFTAVDGNTYDVFRFGPNGRIAGYTQEFTDQIDMMARDATTRLPEWAKYGEDRFLFEEDGSRQSKIVGRRLRETVDRFFGGVFPKRSAYFMQSPVFRQYYYQKVGALIDELGDADIQKVREGMFEAANKLGERFDKKFISRYVGDTATETLTGRGFGKVLWDKFNGPKVGEGTITLDQLDKYARGFALDKTSELFFNAAQKSNLADIYRIVVPFGSAWAEVMASWTKIATSNPEALRRVGLATQGLKNGDPDGDGKGFFYRDPTTGEYVFNYPFNKQLGPLVSYFGGIGALTGLAFGGARGAAIGGLGGAAVGAGLQQTTGMDGATLVAPTKTLTMGFQVFPSLGPFAQIGASKVLGKIPEADEIRRFLTPYGEPEFTLVPSWAQKVVAAVQADDNNRIFGDLKIETMRALAATGNYDLTQESEKERLELDADGRARTMLMLRALGQFAGPTRPDVDFRVQTFAGDKFASELSKAFRDFQTANSDTAVENFLSTFGEDVFLYVASKTKAQVGGLDASREFGNFERDNRSLFARYPQVAGYFAPVGTKFDYQVFLRQIETGKRERLSPSDLVAEAQSLVGKSIYRNVVRQVGPFPQQEERDFLRSVRQDLYSRYPGFQTAPMNLNVLETRITQIERAIEDSILDGNPVAEPTRIYMDARREVLSEARARGLTTLGGKKVADLRAYLRQLADSLLAAYPEFERIYSRVLFDEIDVDAGE